MFNNIIYFIVVLLLFNVGFSEGTSGDFFLEAFVPLVLSWAAFALYSDRVFRRLLHGIKDQDPEDGATVERYQRINVRLSILAICLFALDVYALNLKQWLSMIPGLRSFSVLQGIIALGVFLFYLSTIWYLGHPAYRRIFGVEIGRWPYIQSQLRFNLPILFPWLVLSFIYDLSALSPWARFNTFMDSVYGQMIFFAVFISLLMVILPKFIQRWWGCLPLPPSDKADRLRAFLDEKGFKYRGLVTWPIFEGRMMTAGIMGIVPRYRYILITDSLMKSLSTEELEAVLAHEMGHAKHHHLLLYVVFFIGFMALSFGLTDISISLSFLYPGLIELMARDEARSMSLFYLIISLPMLAALLVYFRFVMGFFMRHFERQADLYSATLMGTPVFTVNSLEKIAFLGGKIRDLPSWHHFSIRERVAYLMRAYQEPGLGRRHHRFVRISFLAYLVSMGVLGYVLNMGLVKRTMRYGLIEKVIRQELVKAPQDVDLYLALAMMYQERGKEEETAETYEKVIAMDPDRAVAFNNLAWLLATTSNTALRNPQKAIELARRAVALERSPGFLDTLAEAYFAAGRVMEAIETIKEALAVATENRSYYKGQLKRFQEDNTQAFGWGA